jgi:hypothetical protein
LSVSKGTFRSVSSTPTSQYVSATVFVHGHIASSWGPFPMPWAGPPHHLVPRARSASFRRGRADSFDLASSYTVTLYSQSVHTPYRGCSAVWFTGSSSLFKWAQEQRPSDVPWHQLPLGMPHGCGHVGKQDCRSGSTAGLPQSDSLVATRHHRCRSCCCCYCCCCCYQPSSPRCLDWAATQALAPSVQRRTQQ